MACFCCKYGLQFSDIWLYSSKLMGNDAVSQENSVGQEEGDGKTAEALCHSHGIGSVLKYRPGKTK